jgi:SNF2 family DNA or RNA helicase
MDQMEDLMLKTKTSYIRIDGSIDFTKRHEAVAKF